MVCRPLRWKEDQQTDGARLPGRVLYSVQGSVMKHLVVRRPSALLPVAMSSAALALMIFMRATWQSRAPAFRAVLAAGLAYGVIGLAFSAADRAASTSEARFGWRLAAWIVSAAVFAVHIAHAHFHGQSRPSPAALRQISATRAM